jgi:TolB protein
MNKILIVFVFFTTCLFAQVDAKLEIVKKIKNVPKVLVTVSTDSVEKDIITKISKLVKKDFVVSGHFKLIQSDIESEFNQIPNLDHLDVDLYVTLSGRESSFGGYIMSIRVYDYVSKEMILDKKITTSQTERYPFLAHRAAIIVNNTLKAPNISWMDKFVVYSVYKGNKKADIYISDYTLTFKRAIVEGGLNIFPKWADKKQENIYYTTYNQDIPKLMKLNIFNRKRETIMSSDGMIIASDVSSDEKSLLVTASPDGLPDIYLVNVDTKSKKRITTYSGIDVGAQFIDDEKRIVFVSDRLKSPNIFAKTIGKKGVERLVYHGRNNSSATAFEDKIVFSSRDSFNEFEYRSFNLYLMSTKSDDLKRLTVNGVNQFPKFSKDGNTLLYIKTFRDESSVGILRFNTNKSVYFPLIGEKIQSIDW